MTGKCNVCEVNEPVGVACSGLGPVSFTYCKTCLEMNAEPLMMMDATFEIIGPDVANHVKKCTTYVDGEYITWDQFVTKRVVD